LIEIENRQLMPANATYQEMKKPLRIVCAIHGEFNQTPSKHRDGGYCCPACSLGKTKDDK